MKKKVIITGATSLIGCGLIRYLLKKNIKIFAVIRPNSKNKRKLNNFNVEIVECDLKNIKNLYELLKKEKPFDAFFHIGWENNNKENRNKYYKQRKNITYSINSFNVANLLGIKTFIGIGSQAEYGNTNFPISENYKPKPENAYGKAKLITYQKLNKLNEKLNIKFIWVRIFSVYGPYDYEKTLINYCINQLLDSKSPILTKCEQKWDYIYVDDVARALYLLWKKAKHSGVYNLGCGKARKLLYYVKIIHKLINPKIKLIIGGKKYSKNQIMYLCADISKIKKEVGFKPRISFKKGIIQTIKYWRKIRDGR